MILRIIYAFVAMGMLTAAPIMANVVTKVSDAPKQTDYLGYLIALVAVVATFAISFTGAKRVRDNEK